MTPEFRRNFPWSLWWVLPSGAKNFIVDYVSIQVYSLSWIWPFMFGAGAVFFTNFDGWNPLAWRSFNDQNANMQVLHSFGNLNGYSNHHFLNLAAMSIFSIGFAVWLWKKQGGSFFSKGLLATYASIIVWTVHEGYWWIAYWGLFYNFSALEAYHFSGLGEMIAIVLALFTPILGMFVPKKYLFAMFGFYVAWILVGFPITESYVGNTIWYGTLWGDSWEVGSWFFAVIGFFALERKGILNWYEKTVHLMNRGVTLLTNG